MRGLRITRWGGTLELFEAPAPVPAAGEVQIRVLACGIGLTVVNYIGGQLGDPPLERPVVPGHELVGHISAVGPGVDEQRVGELVTAHFYLFCGRCRNCLGGFEPLCEHPQGQIGTARDGGYAELTTLPERNVVPLPPGIDFVDATVVADAVATPVHIARRAAITPGDRVCVIGAAGGVGIHMVQVAGLHGGDVVGLDVVPEKLDFLENDLGIDVADSSSFDDVALPSRWDGRADVIVDFVGSHQSIGWALRALGANGRLVLVTTFSGRETPFDPREIVHAQAAVLGSRYASRFEVGLAGALVAAGRVRAVISRRVGLEGVEAIHDELRSGLLLGRGALVLAGTGHDDPR